MKKKLCKQILLLMAVFLTFFAAGITVTEAAKKEKEEEKKPYTVTGTNIKLKVKGGADITEALDDALTLARDKATDKKPYTVVVPKGNYKISSTVHIWSNTTLDLTAGVKFTSIGGTHSLLISGTNGKYKGQKDYNASKACKGYNGFKNITIKGGTFISSSKNTSTIIRIAHAKNVTLEDVTVSGGACAHQIEVAAINGFYVKNCTFKNLKLKKNTTDKQEALQLDIPCASEVFRNVYLDGTVMKNVEITGCTFSNVPRGVGSHTMLVGAYFDNIKINNNTFKNCSEEAIIGVNYRNCEIKDNKIIDCGGGILFDYFKATYKTSVFTTIFDGKKKYSGTFNPKSSTVISGNQISTKYYSNCDEVCGIKVYGFHLEKKAKGQDKKYISAKNYYISDVTVTDNDIQTAGYGIHLMDVRNATVSNNTVTQKNVNSKDKQRKSYSGIFVEKESQKVKVSGNTASAFKSAGILVQIDSQVNTIDANTIKGCKGKGINIYNKSTVDTITANNISNCTEHGIIVGNSSKATTVSGNTISSNGGTESAITAYEKGTIGTIEKNTIQNTSANAVGYSNSAFKITGSATVGSIIENTLVSTGDVLVCASAVLMDNATVTGNIQDNEFGSTESHAIKLTNKSTVGGSISSNTVHKVTAGCGLLMGSGAVVKGSISGNTFDNVSLKGIKITERSKVSGNIDSNILTTKEEGILIYQGTVTGKITGNKIVSQDRSIKITESQIGECKAEDNECSNEVYYR